VHQELDKTAGDPSFDDGLYLVVGAIGEVRNCPAGINEDLVVK
jgi:hypothetical protein